MSWSRVRGHDHLIEGFRRVVERGRLAHGYLFVGPEGVGKRLFATELGRALLCESPPGPLRRATPALPASRLTRGLIPTSSRPPGHRRRASFPSN